MSLRFRVPGIKHPVEFPRPGSLPQRAQLAVWRGQSPGQ